MLPYNSYKKLKEEKKLTIAYLGGSITAQGGCDGWLEGRHGWRGLTTDKMREAWKDCEITEINAGMGGTGSRLGAARLRHDVLKGDPDLLFVEFAVNDGDTDPMEIECCMEGIVRASLRHNPYMDIIFIYTTTDGLIQEIYDGRTHRSRLTMDRIAEYYMLDTIDVGVEIRRKEEQGEPSEKYLLDTVHPTDEGLFLYYQKIREEMPDMFLDRKMPPDTTAPRRAHRYPERPFSFCPRDNMDCIDAWNSERDGFERMGQPLPFRYPDMIQGKPGDTLKIDFNGNYIYFYFQQFEESGMFEWSIDGSEPELFDTWSKFAQNGARSGDGYLLNKAHPTGFWGSGRHTLKIKVVDGHNENSKGSIVRIAAFFAEISTQEEE